MLRLEFLTVVNSDIEDDAMVAVPVTFPTGMHKKNVIIAMKEIVNTYTTMRFEEFCEKQKWKFFLEWKRGNYVYL